MGDAFNGWLPCPMGVFFHDTIEVDTKRNINFLHHIYREGSHPWYQDLSKLASHTVSKPAFNFPPQASYRFSAKRDVPKLAPPRIVFIFKIAWNPRNRDLPSDIHASLTK